MVCAGLAFLAESAASETLYTEKSLYRNIVVYNEAGMRCMKFGRFNGNRQTCSLDGDAEQMVFSYTKMMLGALYLNPMPSSALVIGLGGGTLPTALQKLYPALRMDVVEIDPAVVKVAKRFFAFAPNAQTRVFAQDGRVFIKRALKQQLKYDLVMLDAFDHDYIPEHLLTKEFLQEVRGVLSERGVLAANTFSSSRLYDHESATYYSVFGNFYGLQDNNRIILLRRDGLPDSATLAGNAAALEQSLRRFGVESDWLLPRFALQKSWPAGTRILTDQYSPSNLLNTK